MAKEDLMRFCRYYDGSEESKSTDKYERTLFALEGFWVERGHSRLDIIEGCLKDYTMAGLLSFCATDNVPTTFKAFLFSRYCEERVDVEGFKKWYKEHYK